MSHGSITSDPESPLVQLFDKYPHLSFLSFCPEGEGTRVMATLQVLEVEGQPMYQGRGVREGESFKRLRLPKERDLGVYYSSDVDPRTNFALMYWIEQRLPK